MIRAINYFILSLCSFGLASCCCGSSGHSPEQKKRYCSSDGEYYISIPISWEEMEDSDDSALIQVYKPIANVAFFVHSRTKETLKIPALSLDDVSKRMLDEISSDLSDVDVYSGPNKVSIDGIPGISYELSGMRNAKEEVVCLFTVLESNSHFYILTGITESSSLSKNKPILHDITNSFTRTHKSKQGASDMEKGDS